tara:strand:+ start:229 stop:633 length:405 start_codon:yes stop_codon:yes gene_type:complete
MATPRQKLIKQLDSIFSKFVRMRDADDSGMATCISCGAVKKWREGDAGHFISRGKMSTRYDEQNVHFQCKKCNIFRNGEQYLYSLALDRKYGEGTAERIYLESNKTKKTSIGELRRMIKHYTRKVDEITKQKGI